MDSNLAIRRLPHGSVLGPILFLYDTVEISTITYYEVLLYASTQIAWL